MFARIAPASLKRFATARGITASFSAVTNAVTLPAMMLGAIMLGACQPAEKAGLHLQDAYIKTAVPGRSMTAAYATLTNHEPGTLCLSDFEARFAKAVELHVTEPVGGPNSQQVRMRRINTLCLEPGESTELAPGGKHLMVMGLNELPAQNARIRFGTADGRLFEAAFKVHPFNMPYPE